MRLVAWLRRFNSSVIPPLKSRRRTCAKLPKRASGSLMQLRAFPKVSLFITPQDRLVLCNSRYREILYPAIADAVIPGAPFEMIIRQAVQRGLVEDAKGREEEWIAERIAAHRNPSLTLVQHRSHDHWIQVNERQITGGGTVAVYTDITAIKRHEAELEIARDEAMAGPKPRASSSPV